MVSFNKSLSQKGRNSISPKPTLVVVKFMASGFLKVFGMNTSSTTFQSYLKCQIIGTNDLLDQQEVAFSKHMHMVT